MSLGVGRLAVDQHLSGRRFDDTRENVEQRGLAAAARTADAKEFVLAHGKLHPVVHQQVAIAVRDVRANLDDVFHGRPPGMQAALRERFHKVTCQRQRKRRRSKASRISFIRKPSAPISTMPTTISAICSNSA